MKSRKVSIKTMSPLASLSFKGQATKQATVKWCIMDCYSYYFLFPKCKTHAYTRFENGCSENSTQKLLTKYSTEEKNRLGPY